ncbi:hypothetical protein HZH66_009679 [Vespula vulgaris]|uniref:Uncharacterized protein n=1 Tax=Vespula vulgaris TaxID=7454 RepID=A0A834JQT0_VESVU|nr:hypothetical protein HZH66_009679 [Vespula vulgaris]
MSTPLFEYYCDVKVVNTLTVQSTLTNVLCEYQCEQERDPNQSCDKTVSMNGYSEFLCTDRQLQWSVFSPSELNRRPVVIVYTALWRKAEDEPSVTQLFHRHLWTEEVEEVEGIRKKLAQRDNAKVLLPIPQPPERRYLVAVNLENRYILFVAENCVTLSNFYWPGMYVLRG